ncbi:MAG: murein biosynthesis integral membrane protein MurJ [Firmicutes bacterium]|nr:murein biosynthesis integral membrane protein MurJ [Bacillota bacterium]
MSNGEKKQARVIGGVMLITLASKLLGLLRDRLLAVTFGTGMYANAFLTASRIPRVFFDTLFASAIAASFIPVFTEALEKKGREQADRFAGNFITVMGLLTLLMTAAGIILADPLVTLFAQGYDTETASLCADLTRIMFPTIFFTGVAYAFVGLLQSFDEFNIPALISVVSNLVIIAYYPLLNERFGIYGLAVAFLVGWSLQALIQIPSLRKKGFRYRPSLKLKTEEMKKVFTLMLPVMVSTWVQPVMLTVNSRFASFLGGGSGVSQIEYSTNLYLMIIGVFILSVTNVIFPKLSRLEASSEKEAFQETVRGTMHASLFFVLPMMAGVMALSYGLIDLVYGGGEFVGEDITVTAAALLWMSPGMIGYAVQNILSRVYFARQDGRTPLLAGAVAIAADIVLCKLLIGPFGVAGLALASAAAGTVNAIILMIPLERRKEGFLSVPFLLDLLKMTAAAAVMGILVYFCAAALAPLAGGIAGKLLVLAVPAAAGVIVFFVLAKLLRLQEADMAFDIVLRRSRSE